MSDPRSKNYSPYYKIAFIGKSGVGKTSLVNRLLVMEPPRDYTPTIGYRYFNLDINEEEDQFYLQLWDISGHRVYSEQLESNIRNAAIVVLVFDYNDQESQTELMSLYSRINEYISDSHIIIIGNKAEKVKSEVPKKIRNWVEENSFTIYPVSAINNTGITLILQTLLRIIKDNSNNKSETSSPDGSTSD